MVKSWEGVFFHISANHSYLPCFVRKGKGSKSCLMLNSICVTVSDGGRGGLNSTSACLKMLPMTIIHVFVCFTSGICALQGVGEGGCQILKIPTQEIVFSLSLSLSLRTWRCNPHRPRFHKSSWNVPTAIQGAYPCRVSDWLNKE